ncbi:unnamed protein product [Rhizoctonia solani]|uniref:GATA-type domain-containing protein n=1 Tax=Rhizoctonia solani TaxID=456999 RepID=A0A8H3GY46_9AGAM|nr:unnamed protein product [Rhizoctonia solani]
MSRPSSSRQPDVHSPLDATPPRRPSPTTVAAANAEQAATSVQREASFKDGVLTILSYDAENIFIFSNLSYEHVLESALTNFSALRSSRVERSQVRLAVQTKIGDTDTLVQVTPDTWPAVATRAQVVTVLVQQPSSGSPSQRGPGSHLKLPPPPVPYRLASPVRESESTNWSANTPPPHHSTWHPPYPPTAYTTSSTSVASTGKGASLRSQPHSRQASQSGAAESPRTQYPYAQAHYIPAGPNAVSPTTDVSFLGVRPVVDTDLRRERPDGYRVEPPPKRRWDQLDDASTDERTYATGSGAAPGQGSGNRQQYGHPSQQHEDARKPRRGPDGPKTLCNACGLSYAKDAARREAVSATMAGTQAPSTQTVPERSAPYVYNSDSTNSNSSRPGRGTGGPDGPKTLCNACGLSYAKDAARREAAVSASATGTQAPPAQTVSERLAPYVYNSDSTTSNNSGPGRGTGVKTLDGSSATLSTVEGAFPGPTTAPDVPLSTVQPLRECSMCKRTDSPQWRKGPIGPNTLCNSCGLQWARTQRKSEGTHSRAASSRSLSPAAALKASHRVTPPVSTTIGAEASLAESVTGRRPQLPSRNDHDDEHIRSPPDSLDDAEAQPSP